MQKIQEHLNIQTKTKAELDALIYLPATQLGGTQGAPLLLFLHGMGERGSDLSLVKKHGPPLLIESGTDLPFIVAAPQCPIDAVWRPELLIALLDDLIQRYNVDQRRIYVTGLSMGGSGTWSLANACPDRLAAIAPICGPFTMVEPTNFTKIPVWCFHGAMDVTVSINDSLRMVQWLRNSGSNVRLTIYPDAGHDSWTEPYMGTELYEWLLTHSRP